MKGEDVVLASRQTCWDSWMTGHMRNMASHTTGIMPIYKQIKSAKAGSSYIRSKRLGIGCFGACSQPRWFSCTRASIRQWYAGPEQLFALSFLDELYQGEKWKMEAVQRLDNIHAELDAAHMFYHCYEAAGHKICVTAH